MPTALITGTNRGIGLALTREFLAQDWTVYACCRKPETAGDLKALACARLTILPLDVDSDDSRAALAQRLTGIPIDLLLNNAGIAGDREHESFGNMNYESWLDVLHTNTLSPMKMTEAMLPNLEAGELKHVASISSQLASIAGQQGYMLPYSVSKTALNAVMKNLAAQLSGRLRLNLFSPGWVKTDMGGQDAAITPAESATALYRNIMAMSPDDSGRFIGIDGQDTPW